MGQLGGLQGWFGFLAYLLLPNDVFESMLVPPSSSMAFGELDHHIRLVFYLDVLVFIGP